MVQLGYIKQLMDLRAVAAVMVTTTVAVDP
jgi:hypothetical protein